jgi:hypothetical protein
MGFLLFALVYLVGTLIWNQNKMLYVPLVQAHPDFPSKDRFLGSNPPGMQAPPIPFTDLVLGSVASPGAERIDVHAWLFPNKRKGGTLMIYLHGNAGYV